MCGELHELDESKVRNKQYYITPRECTDGDYYIDAYFWFPCNCGRAIKVEEEGLPNPYGIEKEYSKHVGVCSSKNIDIKDIRKYKLSKL